MDGGWGGGLDDRAGVGLFYVSTVYHTGKSSIYFFINFCLNLFITRISFLLHIE